MIRFIRALLIPPAKVKATPEKQLGIRLDRIKGALIVEKHFPRPQWPVVEAWVKDHVKKDDLALAWNEIGFDWLSTLKNHLGEKYSVYGSSNFILLTSRSRNAAQFILKTCEVAARHLVQWLGPIAEKHGHGKHIVLDFDSLENYYDYVSYFYGDDTGIRASGGIFLSKGYQHIAMPPAQSMQDTLVHELAHNRLAHAPIPLWLNEGIAMTMERKLGSNSRLRIDRDKHKEHLAYWTPETIQGFWRGTSFNDENGEAVGLSYSLADTLIDLMVQEFPQFMEFVAEANYRDGGQAAARKFFDHGLEEIVATILGPGNWAPVGYAAEPPK